MHSRQYYINQNYIPMKKLKISTHRTRRGCRYAKASLSAKVLLLKAVFEQDQPIKKASQALNIKYSTAQTLIRSFKKANSSIDWNFAQKQIPVKNVKITGVKRCHYIQLDKLELKNECRQSQTDASYGNCTPELKFLIEQNHARNGVSFPKIQIVSRIVEESLSFKPGFLLG